MQAFATLECKRPGCPFWVEVEGGGVKYFYCEICQSVNCVSCGAIHPDLKCYEYQRILKDTPQNHVKAFEKTSYLQENNTWCEVLEARRKQHFSVADADLVLNQDRFQCPICYSDVEPGEGVVLHECLHSFCKSCLEGHVKALTEARAGCPFIVENCGKCDKDILEREIKAFASAEVYKHYLQQGVDEHKTRTEERLECKTPNCKYWIVVDGQLKYFLCEVCHHVNCVSCEAIHESDTCKKYQRKLRNIRNADVNEKEIEARITAGVAMRCPGCKIIIERVFGCDFVQCTACRMEICWITKQRRWGPKGIGDTSAGCKCRSKELNGEACHPECGSCH